MKRVCLLVILFSLPLMAQAPQLIQSSDDSDWNPGQSFAATWASGTYETVALPNKTTAGNLLTVFIALDGTGTPPTVTLRSDGTSSSTVQGTFTQLNATGSCTVNSRNLYMYYLPNVAAGFNIIRVAYASSNGSNASGPMAAEWSGVATTTPLDGFTCANSSGTSGTPLTFSGGSFTPVGAGDLVVEDAWNATASNSSGASVGGTHTAGTGQSGITWNVFLDSAYYGNGAQWGVWENSTALNPSFTVTSPTGTTPEALSISAYFKPQTGAGGSPSGIHVITKKQVSNTSSTNGTPQFSFTSLTVPFPCTGGNLMTADWNSGAQDLTAVSDATNGSWTSNHTLGDPVTVVHTYSARNATTSQTLKVSLTWNTAAQDSAYLYCIAGAATAPFDKSTVAGTNVNGGTTLSITPATSNGLVLYSESHATASTWGFSSPAGAIFQGCIVSNENTDGGGCSANNGWGLLNNTTTAAESWTGTTCPSTGCANTGTGEGISTWAGQADAYIAAPTTNVPWSGILSSNRAINWGNAGLPATFPDGETSANAWTPPVRTQCNTAACNTVSGGSVTVANINAALNSAPAGTFVLIPAGTFTLTGTIQMVNNVTLRGSGASQTIINGATVAYGSMGYGTASLLSGTINKGATAITVAAGQSVPTGGRLVFMGQCDTGTTAANANYMVFGSGTNCTGTITDPACNGQTSLNNCSGANLTPSTATLWVCGSEPQCSRDKEGPTTNPHSQGQIFWLPSTGVSGNTLTLDSSSFIESPVWSTSNTAAIITNSGTTLAGAGMEDIALNNTLSMQGCYGCWMKGLRIAVSGDISPLARGNAHTLIANNYFAATDNNGNHLISIGSNNDPLMGDSDGLFINNIISGFFLEEDGANSGFVMAYNFWRGVCAGCTSGSGGFAENGDFAHNMNGHIFMLREGNETGNSWDDATHTGHNLDTWFRNWVEDFDPYNNTSDQAVDIGAWSRFENVVGNVLGSSGAGVGISYQGTIRINQENTGATTCPSDICDQSFLTNESLMRWGNYNYCTGDTHCRVGGTASTAGDFDTANVPCNTTGCSLVTPTAWGTGITTFANPVPATHTLPPSFFLSVDRSTQMGVHASGGTQISWWKTCASWTTFPTACASFTTPAMPPFGPDVTTGANVDTHASSIPAFIALNSLPADPAFPNAIGGMKQFDERVYTLDSGITSFTLSVSNGGQGFGSVASNDGFINCGVTCSANYTSGSVILTATTANISGMLFTGWTVDGSNTVCPGKGTCTVSMTANHSVTANFVLGVHAPTKGMFAFR